MMTRIQQFCAGSRLRFGASFVTLLLLSMIAAAGPLFLPTHIWLTAGARAFHVILALVVLIVLMLYGLRLRQIGRSPLWALLVFVPAANMALPIFLLIENSPEERAPRSAFIFAAICIVGLLGLSAYQLSHPPGFSRADPTGCYLAEGKPIFQLRGGKLLLPSGTSTGVTYYVDRTPVGNSVVTDHEIGLATTPAGLALKIGNSERRWNSSIDRDAGPAMMMTADNDLTPILAVRQNECK